MSELKATTVYDAYWKANSVGEGTGIQVYLKYEADKVIAELETKLARAQLILRLNKPETLYSNLDTMCRLNHKIDVVERRELHQKYKRCLNMAEMCGNAYDKWMMKKANAIGLGKDGVEYYLEARWKVSHYMRWYKHWLELSKKFKEADDGND